MIRYNFLDKLSLNDLVNYYDTGDIIRLNVYNNHRIRNAINPHVVKAVIISRGIESNNQLTRVIFTVSIEGEESYSSFQVIYTNNINNSIDKIRDPIDLTYRMSRYGDGFLVCIFNTSNIEIVPLDSYSNFKELIGADVKYIKCSNSKLHKGNSISANHRDNYIAKSKVRFSFKNLLITDDWVVISIQDRHLISYNKSVNSTELRKFIDFLGGIVVDHTMNSDYSLVPFTKFKMTTRFFINLNRGKRSRPRESAFTEYNESVKFRKSRVKALSEWRYKNKVRVNDFDKFPTEVYNNVKPY